MAKNEQLTKEQAHHQAALEFYCAQGPKRSYRLVANQYGVSQRTVKLWSKSFNWRERVAEHDAAIARRVADNALKSGIDQLTRNRKIVSVAIARLAQGIVDGKVKFQAADLDRFIRLQQMLEHREELEGIPVDAEGLVARLRQMTSKLSPEEVQRAIAILRGQPNADQESADTPPEEVKKNCP